MWNGGSLEHHGCCDHCGVPGGDGYRHLGSGWEMGLDLGAFQIISTIIGIKSQGDLSILSIPKFSRNYHQIYHYIIDINCK